MRNWQFKLKFWNPESDSSVVWKFCIILLRLARNSNINISPTRPVPNFTASNSYLRIYDTKNTSEYGLNRQFIKLGHKEKTRTLAQDGDYGFNVRQTRNKLHYGCRMKSSHVWPIKYKHENK